MEEEVEEDREGRAANRGAAEPRAAQGVEGALSAPLSPIDMLISFLMPYKEHLCTFKRLLNPGHRSLLSTN